MCSKKKDLEIICNLQWKNRPHNGGERSNIIGVYDVPSTTLNWEIFKSYLLKNSGTPGDDVKVSYLATNDRDFPIQSQLDFQIALYAFRKKARNGEIINLKLDRISDQDKLFKKIPTSNDVQTQFDTIEKEGPNSSLSTHDSAPQWFTNHMTEFKKDIINEVSATVSGYLSTIKAHGMQSYHSRKSKTESSKRSRKHPLILCDVGNEKEFLKTIKLEKKVETKLEKLETKSKKLKEKKMSLLTKSSDSDAGHSSSKSNSDTFLSVDMNQMNAAPVRYQQSIIPHMMGGEVYLHTWEVINNGSLPWTSDTELHFTWGSASLEPVERIVPCPPLKPGESGSINVLLNVPKICGQYESYWYFHHKGRKFGHWLGCQIIVDKINSAEPLTKSFLNSYEDLKYKYNSIFKTMTDQKIPRNEPVNNVNVSSNMVMQVDNQPLAMTDIENKVKDLQIVEACSSSENDQIEDENKISPAGITLISQEPCSSSTDFLLKEKVSSSQTEIEEVVLNASPSKIQIVEKFITDMKPSNSCNLEKTVNDFKEVNQNKQLDTSLESDDNNNNTEGAQDSSSESISKIDEDTSSNSTFNDMVMINFPDEMEDHDTGYAYVVVDGTKIPIPKKYLRSDFLETAEDAPNPFVKVSNEFSEATTVPQDFDEEKMKQFGDNENKISTKRDDTPPLIPTSNPEQNTAQGSEVSYNFLSQDSQVVNDSVQYSSIMAMASSRKLQDDQSDDGNSNPRMFVFPQYCPGYEVISNQSVPSEPIQICSESGCAKSTTQYSFSNSNECNNQFMRCNIYQQDPSETNLQYENLPYSTCHQSVFTNVHSQPNPTTVEFSAGSFLFPIQSEDNNKDFKSSNSIEFTHVPNYQQTPPELRSQLRKEKEESKPEPKNPSSTSTSANYSFPCSSGNTYSVHKEEDFTSQANMPASSAPAPMASVVSGAMTMASSALNTAKNVVNMIIPPRSESEPGVWMNGHWVLTNPNSLRESNLQALAEMGFWDRDLNATLLARFNDDIAQVIAELIQ